MSETFTTDSRGRSVIEKDPDATLDYTFDWAAWLADISDTIDAATVTVAGVTLVVVEHDATSVTAWIAGGDLGAAVADTWATCTIVTLGGRTEQKTIYFKMKEN